MALIRLTYEELRAAARDFQQAAQEAEQTNQREQPGVPVAGRLGRRGCPVLHARVGVLPAADPAHAHDLQRGGPGAEHDGRPDRAGRVRGCPKPTQHHRLGQLIEALAR